MFIIHKKLYLGLLYSNILIFIHNGQLIKLSTVTHLSLLLNAVRLRTVLWRRVEGQLWMRHSDTASGGTGMAERVLGSRKP